jgi:16S rRNA (adenine1518-N6/adenine1519-N6)-dimethyltransferase
MKKNNKPSPFKPAKKKQLGQHFLRKQSVVNHMINRVKITPETSILEIGCGDGFLTQAILVETNCKQLFVYEIDHEWADFVRNKIKDERLTIKEQNILEIDTSELETHKPWILLANLPYQITFPIMFLLQKNKVLFQEGVVMVQEEVAQKIVATHGRSCNATSMFLQYHFNFELMEKIEPEAFSPPPKVHSRLLYFKPKFDLIEIPEEEKFWKFLKLCFLSPRRTLHNNLKTTHFDLEKIPKDTLKLRAQQLSFDQFLKIWVKLTK